MEHKHHSPISIIVILFAIIIGTVFLLKDKEGDRVPNKNDNNQPVAITPAYKCGFTVNSLLPNSTVGFPLNISGVINNATANDGCTWVIFEGVAGTAKLTDGVTTYAMGPVLVAGDWMNNLPHNFSVALMPANPIPSGTALTLIFTEEDPSGQGLIDTLYLPVVAQ